MSTSETSSAIEHEFQIAVEHAMKGVRDPEAMREAAERMDRMREDIHRKHGILDLGVPAIRDLRDD